MSKSKNSRRKFLSTSLFGGSAIIAGKANDQFKEKEEKVKMLTPDGQLVEVDKSVLEKAVNRKKADNKSIFEWANPDKK